MFVLNEDKSIYITRGDIAFFAVQITQDIDGEKTPYLFQLGEVVRFKVFEKKGCDCVVLQKDFPVLQETDTVEIFLTEEDTKIGGIIHKPKDYWYEVELNPETNPQTVIAYDEEGARIFKLFPEGNDEDVNADMTPEDIPLIDQELDTASGRPIANAPVAMAILKLETAITDINIVSRASYDIALKIKEMAERGEFDGEDGQDGYTPVKGKDYFTPSDVAQIVYDVAKDLEYETWTFVLDDGSVQKKAVMTAEVLSSIKTEKWKFAMENGSVVNKRVVLSDD